jgi:hypothetical protein
VQPGTRRVGLWGGDLDQQALVGELERFAGAKLVYANLDPLWVDRIRSALGDAPAAPAPPADVPTPPQVDPGSASSDPPPH